MFSKLAAFFLLAFSSAKVHADVECDNFCTDYFTKCTPTNYFYDPDSTVVTLLADQPRDNDASECLCSLHLRRVILLFRLCL
jgi:hypothetical protein